MHSAAEEVVGEAGWARSTATAGPTKVATRYDQGRGELKRAGGDKVEELGWERC